MNATVAWIASALALALICDFAAAERLVASLSAHQVRVSSNFTGADLVLFGYIERGSVSRTNSLYGVAVIVKGPSRTLVLRRKKRKLGIWVAGQGRTYPNAPSYMTVLVSRSPTDLEASGEKTLTEIALKESINGSGSNDQRPDAIEGRALVSEMKDRGLYILQSNEITFLTPTLFRADTIFHQRRL